MSWEPALKTLVSSIGAKFSAAFDRTFAPAERLPPVLLMSNPQESAVPERSKSPPTMKTMDNGQSIFSSSSVTMRNFNC